MLRVLQVVGFVFVVDVVLLFFGVFALHMGRTMKKVGMSVWKEGIVPPYIWLFGQRQKTEIRGVPKYAGCLPLYGSIFALLFGWLSLITIPIFTIGFLLAVFLPAFN